MKRTVTNLLICVACVILTGNALAGGIEILRDEMHEVYEEGGTLLATLDAAFPQLAGMDDAAAMERINTAIRDLIPIAGEFEAIRGYALEDYTNAPERFAENEYGLQADAQAELLNNDTLLAVRCDFLLSTGGPHPWDTIVARHFDLSTGAQVTLATLTRDPEALRARVEEETLNWIGRSGFDAFGDAGERAREWPLEQALLTAEGLLAFYNEGELGPVYEGAVEIVIPYDRLLDLLDVSR